MTAWGETPRSFMRAIGEDGMRSFSIAQLNSARSRESVRLACTLAPRARNRSIRSITSRREMLAIGRLPHIRMGRITVDARVSDEGPDISTFKRLYAEAVSVAESVWESNETMPRLISGIDLRS